jgi:predicted small metal-binding protein
MRTIVASLLVLVFCTASVTMAQEMDAKEKAAMQVKQATKSGLKSVSCAPECGFMVRSHDEKELSAIVIEHAKTHHNKTVTEKDVKAMMKSEEVPAAKSKEK